MPHHSYYHDLAVTLTKHATQLKQGDHVLIEATEIPEEFLIVLMRQVRSLGAVPFLQLNTNRLTREMALGMTEEQAKALASLDLHRIKKMDACIALRGSHNIMEHADVAPETLEMLSKVTRPAINYRVNKTRWVLLRWPHPSMAQQAQRSTEDFEEFFFQVCTMDYSRMIPGMEVLKELMERTDQVRIEGPGIDLRFSIKGVGAVACGGTFNLPDGEVFSAPVRDSVEGVISFNAPTLYRGLGFDHIKLTFEKGKIVDAQSSNTRALNEILDTDPGARYIGEFALGFHPLILHPMRDILFDEKIAGSFHFTPGQAYEMANNGNKSAIHWDMVAIQRPEYGGGSIWFDDVLVRKDGLFTLSELKSLNPKELLKKGKARKAAPSPKKTSSKKEKSDQKVLQEKKR
jgi:aminopeptidase